MIGPHWLGEQADGSRRIDEQTDIVRLEIEYALKRKIPIIPLLINNTQMPRPDKLPNEIEALAFRNALPLDSGLDFHQHVDRLIGGVGELSSRPRIQSLPSGKRAAFEPRPTHARRLFQSRKLVVSLVLVALAIVTAWAWFFIERRSQFSYVAAPAAAEKVEQPTPTPATTQPDTTPAPLPSKEVWTPPVRTTLPVADVSVRSAKEVASCGKYRATAAGDPSGDAPSWTMWILSRPDDHLIATVPIGSLPVSGGVFSAEGDYLVYEAGSASAGSRMELVRVKEDGGIDRINLGLDERAPQKLLQAKLGLPAGGFFNHSYSTPVGISTTPLAINFEFYVDRYSMDNGPSIQINKATKFTYLIDANDLEITGPLPKSQPSSVAATPTPTTKKLFAGTWEGAVHYSSPGGTFRLNPNAPASFVINESETRATLTFEHTSEPNRIQIYGLSRMGPNRATLRQTQGQLNGQTLTVQGDTLTFTMDDRPTLDVVTRGSFHRKR